MSSGRCRPGSGGTGGWPRGPRWGEAGEVLPHEGAGGQHRFAAQHGATTLAADEGGREPGDGFVPQVAEVLERLTVEPRGVLPRQHFRPPHSAAPTPRPTPRNPCGASASICPVTLACSTPRPQRPPSPHRIKPPPNPGRLTSAERLQPKPAPSTVTTTDQTERSHPGRPQASRGLPGQFFRGCSTPPHHQPRRVSLVAKQLLDSATRISQLPPPYIRATRARRAARRPGADRKGEWLVGRRWAFVA